MSRRIIETELQASGQKSDVDGYLNKVMKYIPSETVGVWITIKTMIEGNNDIPQSTILWGIFIFCLFLTFAYIRLLPSDSKNKPTIKQAIISVGAFIFWAIAIGGEPFKSISGYYPIYGSILMILYTAIIPLVPLEQRKLS
ncbi:MAG: hypothetical protein IV298_15175 [Cylindrospermopsis raciborskii KL1]|jgi:hypothetical protein|uniref:hypothetical protein n=1 Tax=Cylindrospermopsis raciborskii TaxID=77022 RepID=UPI0008DE0C2C|nr:hypothetical protein [Cylindrospermopsis raciborskii]MBG0744780.1 hypothetical protein [Cylindrospermopsis raciborskii KL1]MCZ2207666.1 hypothetical protein [Cylindrospermopsis raciborskii PAMP2011]NLQ03586.1 hypothetical protein [Cylindrospermopsis raciborskii MVCC19]OHY33102.1 hypothetical protein BCV64_10280 [Cylindrospermopsis raciborskii MVCC14]